MTVEAGHVRLEAHPSKIRETKPHEYVLRFVFGGVITAVVGMVGKAFGPAVAGLFLAFPAILPARGCSTLGKLVRIRVPLPAARTIAASSLI